MAHSDADMAIESFLDLERRFDHFVRVVPIAPEHNRVHSPSLASILLDTCSLIETALKSTMDNSRYDKIANIAQLRQRRHSRSGPHLTMGDLRNVFRSDTFYTKPVWYLPRGDRSFPWYAWRQTNGQPKWWNTYNAVKHARFQNAPQATLLTTLHAMKGLFLVLAQSLDFRGRMIDRGLIRGGPSMSNGQLSNSIMQTHACQWEPFDVLWQDPIVASTRLFGYKFLTKGSPKHPSDATAFL